MRPLGEPAIRASFVNCTKGEAKRITLPRDLDTRPWADLDFLGWTDPSGSERAYLVAEADAGPVGVVLRAARQGAARRSMCSLCLTTHSGGGVLLMTARKAGLSGRQGNSAGTYICADLACSLYLRGKRDAERPFAETLSQEEKIERARANLAAFLAQIVS